jgi:hypothetical protein
MEWLCEATPEEIVRVGRKTETIGSFRFDYEYDYEYEI